MDTIGDKLTDPAFFATHDPHPLWKRMRAEDPVHWAIGNLRKGFWSITKYEDALTVLRDPVTFSSEALGMSMPTRELEDIERADLGCGAMIIAMDPPRHNPMRRALSGNFLRSHVRQLGDTLPPRGGGINRPGGADGPLRLRHRRRGAAPDADDSRNDGDTAGGSRDSAALGGA